MWLDFDPAAMLQYTAAELRACNVHDVRPLRSVRKAILALGCGCRPANGGLIHNVNAVHVGPLDRGSRSVMPV